MSRDSTLIVGGAGFLGNSLAQSLSVNGYPVIVADSNHRLSNYAIPLPGVEYVTLNWPDISLDSVLKRVRSVVHLAWTGNPASSMRDVESDASDNIIGTVRLLEAAPGIERFIFMSSGGTVYGNSPDSLVMESSTTNPVSAYGISKLSCEKYVQMYSTRGGFSHINLRLGNPYGSYQLNGTPVGVIANFIRKIFNNEPIDLYGNGEIVRDYLYIDDFANSVMLLLQSPCASGVYNLGSGVGTSLLEIIEAIEHKSSKKIRVVRHEERRSDVRSVVLDVTKLGNEINYKPNITLSLGIEKMIDEHISKCSDLEKRSLESG